MRWTRFVLGGSAVVTVIAMSGCDPKPGSDAPASSATSTASSGAAVTTSAAAAGDAATAKACADIQKDLKDNAAKVAAAAKIGPPAGHIAVSAQWTAGSTSVIAHSIGANAAVSAAADKVQQQMEAIGDAYNKSSSAKPSQAKLQAAVKELTAACAAA